MKIFQVLIINSRGYVKMVKNDRMLDLDEISIKLRIEIPDSLFPVPKTFIAPVTITDETKSEQTIEIKIL